MKRSYAADATIRILAIDDSSSVLSLYQDLLGELNVKIDTAADGRQGLELALKNPYDIIITDVDMPQMDGIELCRQLRANPKTSDIPLIISSVFHSDEDIEKGFATGASAYLGKNEVPQFLAKTVTELFWKKQQFQQRKLLVVDDSRSILQLVARELADNGFIVNTAENGKQALAILAAERPDLILSDISMPVMDGFELCKAVKADPEFASIPFVVMSTIDDRSYMNRMIQYGAASYLVKPFSIHQLVVLIEKILSDHFLLLLQERERLEDERKGLLGSITSLVSALEARDPYTRGHSEAVAKILAEFLSLTGAGKDEVATATIGGRLHDIGKIGVRDSVLLKAGRLTDDEYEHIKKHPQTGKEILAAIPSLEAVLPIVHCHHEHWNGNGYPAGLKGKDIPFWARLTAVADIFHALTSNRPYRKALSNEQAFDIIKKERGRQLCPEAVDLFFHWLATRSEDEPLY